MKDKNIHKAIHDLKDIRMTDQEKKAIQARIVATPAAHPHKVSHSIRSPWTTYSLGVWVSRQRWVVATLVLVVIAGSGGVASAAENALPGSTLYSVKVSIVEPIRDVLVVSAEGEAEWQAEKAERRLNEATLLAIQGKLDAPVQKEIEERLEKHSIAFASALDEVRQKGNEDRADEISVAFQAGLGARAQVLEVLAQDKHADDPTEDRRMTVAAIARTGAQNVRDVRSSLRGVVLAKGGESASPQAMMMTMSAPAPESAVTNTSDNARVAKSAPVVADTATTAEESATVTQNKNKQDSYNRSKASAERVITTVSENIRNTSSKADSLRGKIFNNASMTLDEARQSLRDADERYGAGDEDDAYMLILESERAAKEANIIFNEGLKIRQQDPVSDETSRGGNKSDSSHASKDENKNIENKANVVESVKNKGETKKDSIPVAPSTTEQNSVSSNKKDSVGQNDTKGKGPHKSE